MSLVHRLIMVYTFNDTESVYYYMATANDDCVKVCDTYFKHLQIQDVTHQVNKELFGVSCSSGSHIKLGLVGETRTIGSTTDTPFYQNQCACKRHQLVAYLSPI